MKKALLGAGGIFGFFLFLKRLLPPPPPREPLPKEKEKEELSKAAIIALQEVERWRGLTETDAEAAPLLSKYWASINTQQPPDIPWSAAFISWVLRKATDGRFVGNASHLKYARGAYKNRGTSGTYAPFDPKREAFDIQPGDVILRARGGDAVSFDDLRGGSTFFKRTHGDIVVEMGDGYVVAVGGNKGNTVASEIYPVGPDGMPTAPDVFAILKWQEPLTA